jgi:YfiH family protein
MGLTRLEADLGPGVNAWFTGRSDEPDPDVGRAGNLSHHRPHQPARLAADRVTAFAHHGVSPAEVHLLRQVHGGDVAVVDATTPPGYELRDVDAAVTAEPGRALAVLTADCVPVLLAGPTTVAAVHAGRRGLASGVVGHALDALTAAQGSPDGLRAVVGPAIGGCCYEVPEPMQHRIAADHPGARSTTSWGTPSLDLPVAVAAILETAGVATQLISRCTRCDPSARFFSHRADPDGGRQAAVVVRGSSP